MSTFREIVFPGDTFCRNWTTGYRYILVPPVYVNSTLPGNQGAVPALLNFQSLEKGSCGWNAVPLLIDCEISWQASSGDGVAGVPAVAVGRLK